MPDLQLAKNLVRKFQQQFDSATSHDLAGALESHTTPDYRWEGVHPFGTLCGARAVEAEFWLPLRNAFNNLRRRQDVFFAGQCDNGHIWVGSMGHLVGLFDQPWLGILPTGKLTFISYAEFHRVDGNRITETVMICDLLKVLHQAGQYPLPGQTGAILINPGPETHDGLLFAAQPQQESQQTLKLMNRMIMDLLSSDLHSPAEQLGQTWRPDMFWFGPSGIGSTYTLDRYEQQHQGPFSSGLIDFGYTGHRLHIAEGHYAGLYGVMSVRPTGGFMGMPAQPHGLQMRVIDIYRREGEKLAENWIFIDMLDFLHAQGLDVLERQRQLNLPTLRQFEQHG